MTICDHIWATIATLLGALALAMAFLEIGI